MEQSRIFLSISIVEAYFVEAGMVLGAPEAYSYFTCFRLQSHSLVQQIVPSLSVQA